MDHLFYFEYMLKVPLSLSRIHDSSPHIRWSDGRNISLIVTLKAARIFWQSFDVLPFLSLSLFHSHTHTHPHTYTHTHACKHTHTHTISLPHSRLTLKTNFWRILVFVLIARTPCQAVCFLLPHQFLSIFSDNLQTKR